MEDGGWGSGCPSLKPGGYRSLTVAARIIRIRAATVRERSVPSYQPELKLRQGQAGAAVNALNVPAKVFIR